MVFGFRGIACIGYEALAHFGLVFGFGFVLDFRFSKKWLYGLVPTSFDEIRS